MRPRYRWELVGWSGIFLVVLSQAPRSDEAPMSRPTAAKRAIAPAAPALPAEVVAAMQEGRYADADAALGRLADPTASADDRAYIRLIRGIARRLDKRDDFARQTLAEALRDAPRGAWSAKIRSELAALELAGGHPDVAERLARDQAEEVLAPSRKDRLAEVYYDFARTLITPEDPTIRPDPGAGYALLAEARSLAKGETFRARLLFEMARAAQAAGTRVKASKDFKAYLEEYPAGADRVAARYFLGETQLASEGDEASDPQGARRTWTNLADDLAAARRPLSSIDDDLRARALFQIARTYGFPSPSDDTQLHLGIAALRRFLAAYPSHPLAVTASYQVGASYLARKKGQEALDALTAFLEEDGFRVETDQARRDLVPLAMSATFQVAEILRDQRKYAEAIAAWKGYLARFPDGRQSADAQRAILDTQLLVADEHLRRGRYVEARAAWAAFSTQNPLDSRVPETLFQVGESFATEKRADEAIAAWDVLTGKFPASEPASHAQFRIAEVMESAKGDPAAAIRRFANVAGDPWKTKAVFRVAVMEAKALNVATPRAFRSGESAHLRIMTRNLETLTFAAYRLNAEAYFRKKHALNGVESLDIDLVRPDVTWTAAVPDYAKYKPIERDYLLAKLALPGVWVVKVGDATNLQATTLVLGSDLDAIVKSSQEQFLIFAQDMKTGRGRPGARVLVADDGGVILEAKTGGDGVLLHTWDERRDSESPLNYLVIDGRDVAAIGLPDLPPWTLGLSARGYLATDRPAYRPGQRVALRGVVREVKDGQYANVPGQVYRLEVADVRGRRIVARPVTLSDFGTFHTEFPIDVGAPVGTYRIRLSRPGETGFDGRFVVQSYRLQKVALEFDLRRTVFARGETIEVGVVARHQTGVPASGRPILLQLPQGRLSRGTTDAEGRYRVALATDRFAEEEQLFLVAQLPQDDVTSTATVMLAPRTFSIGLHTDRGVYLDGELFRVEAETADVLGTPTGHDLSASVIKLVTTGGVVAEREVERKDMRTDPKSGRGSVALKVEDVEGGRYLIRVTGTDRFGNPVVAERTLTISTSRDATKLRFLSDRQDYKVGQEARINLVNRGPSGPALLVWEADRILRYKIERLGEGENPISWPVEGDEFPNVTLTAERMSGTSIDEARLDLRVERDLRVRVRPTKTAVGPGDEVEVEVETLDQLGKPVSAEVALALVDYALLQRFRDPLPPIGAFFYDQRRSIRFITNASNAFAYKASTSSISKAVVEEAERSASRDADAGTRDKAIAEGRNGVEIVRSPDKGIEYELTRRPGKRTKPPKAAASATSGPEVNEKAVEGLQTLVNSYFQYSFAARSAQSASLIDPIFGDPNGVPPLPREYFAETAYWNPSIVTDRSGKARVSFRAPSALSKYRFLGRGVGAADTLVGQATADLVVRKSFFVEIKAPAVLTQGDRPRFVAHVHHAGIAGKVALKLVAEASDSTSTFPRDLEIKGDGVDEVIFESFEVPSGDVVRLSLTATADGASDRLVVEAPIRPWGVQAVASASGTSVDDATVFVGLPPGREYEGSEMLVVVSPTVRRMLVELALGGETYALGRSPGMGLLPTSSPATADRAGDLLAAAEAMGYLRAIGVNDSPEVARLTTRIQDLVSELIASQDEDGGWSWVVGAMPDGESSRPAEPLMSARVVWALASAEALGMLTEPEALEKAASFLTAAFEESGNDRESRAVLLHALSLQHKATFAQVNTLLRARQTLSDAALAYVALTLANLDRTALAGEVLDVLASRARSESADPGTRPRSYWESAGASPGHRDAAEATALAALAFARARPRSELLAQSVDWLLAHRQGIGWQTRRATAPALAALAAYYGKAERSDDRYRLVVTVNDTEVARLDVTGATEGRALLVPRKALKTGDRNRVRFDIDGRGTFGFAVTQTGFTRDFAPDQSRANRTALIDRRVYLQAEPEREGQVLPTGFGVAVNAAPFENLATQVAAGGKARVEIAVARDGSQTLPDRERDSLVVEEHLPAGATLVEGSVQSTASTYTLVDGVLSFYFDPSQPPGTIRYDVYGYLPGRYRTLPTSVRSASAPGRAHLGPAGALQVLAPGEPNTDTYRPTPDELYARGKAEFDAGRLVEATASLEPLFAEYTLRDDVAKDAARMLLLVNIRRYDPRKVVQYFEAVKERAPEQVIGFDDLRTVGRAYRDLGEHERAYLIWRGLTEASYLEDSRVAVTLMNRGQILEGIATLTDLWREYPETPSIDADFLGAAQTLARYASQAQTDPEAHRALRAAGVSRPDLSSQVVRRIQSFLAQSPLSPLADEASLALVGAFLELQDHESVVRLSSRFARLYPRSPYFDSFQYGEALGNFHLGRYDRAAAVAEAIVASKKEAPGAESTSSNRWQALYILGQIDDARRRPARALGYYRQVADRFSDAAGAVKAFTRKDLQFPEVTVLRPGSSPNIPNRDDAILRAAVRPDVPEIRDAASRDGRGLTLGYRNVAEADVKVYPVDLMRLYLTRRDLDAIADIDLAGITPLLERTIKLGDVEDYEDRLRTIGLDLAEEGAYLVMVRGGTLYASGVVLVSPLVLEVLEGPGTGTVRVSVRDARTKAPAPRVQVKVGGSEEDAIVSGETDLRGVFVAQGLRGAITAVACQGTARYALYRGKGPVVAATKTTPAEQTTAPAAKSDGTLEDNLKSLNRSNQRRQVERLQERYRRGGQGGAEVKGFK